MKHRGIFMHQYEKTGKKVIALILVGLFFGSSLAIFANLSSGDREGGNEYSVVLTIEENEKMISVNEKAYYWGSIKNAGDMDDNFTFRFGGKDYGNEGITVELYDALAETDVLWPLEGLSIWSGDTRYFRLEITFTVEEGSYEISMMVQSESDEDVWDAAKTVTQVFEEQQTEYDFTLIPRQTEIVTGYGILATYTMTLKNTGNVEDGYLISLDYLDSYWHLDIYLTYAVFSDPMGPPIWEGPGKQGDSLEFYLGPGQEMQFMLHVIVYDIRDNENPGDNFGTEDYEDIYLIYVNAMSLNGPEILKTVETRTIIKESSEDRLSFACYDPEMSIVAGGVAEYFLFLSNTGWSPVEVYLGITEHQYPDITAELFLAAPCWIMDDDEYGPYSGMPGGMKGTVYDENSDPYHLTREDILWEDYGGLIPVDENFTYIISPHETVHFLLRVTHDYEGDDGDVTPALYSAEYEIGVTVDSEKGFHETVMTITEVIFNPTYGIKMWVNEQRKVTVPYEPVEYIITIKNTGNVEEVVELSLGGSAYMMEGVSAFLYVMSDWYWDDYPMDDPDHGDWCYEEPIFSFLPIITLNDDGSRDFFHELYPYDEWSDFPDSGSYPEPNPDIIFPEPIPEEPRIVIEAGEEIKVMLWVMVIYENGTFEIAVEGVVSDHPETAREVTTETVIKEIEYLGFEMEAPVTEQTAFPDEAVDYHIRLYNPGYYTDEISLELGGKSYMMEGVQADLYLMNNVYYFDPYLDQYMQKENENYYVEYGGSIYDPAYTGEEEFREKYPDNAWNDDSWFEEPDAFGNGEHKEAEPGMDYSSVHYDDEYFLDSNGGIYKNYEYEYGLWEGPDGEFDEDEWLIPLIGEDRRIHLGPFESVWLLLRVTTSYDEGVTNIDVIAQSILHPEYSKIASTNTRIIGTGNHGLELFIGDPVHYTTYGVTTVYVFQLTNTGDVRDTVLLELTGTGTQDPNVYIEIGVKDATDGDTVFLRDKYNNMLLPYDTGYTDEGNRYTYQQWANDPEIDPSLGPFWDPDDPINFERNVVTSDGEQVEPGFPGPMPPTDDEKWSELWGENWQERWKDPSTMEHLMTEPITYGYMDWDVSGERPEPILDEFQYGSSQQWWGNAEAPDSGSKPGTSKENGLWGLHNQENSEFFDLDSGFIPYPQYGERYVGVEAGETVIVTMKVTVFDWDVLFFDQETGEPYFMSDNEEIPRSDTNTSYDITLVAKSLRAPEVSAEAETITYIYDETTSKGIWDGKISGIFNVHDRIITHEILEDGFLILPVEVGAMRIELRVVGNFSEGRLLVIHLDASNLEELGDSKIFFDEVGIEKMDPVDILTYDGEEARYSIIETENGLEYLVYIPHFSEHSIAIQSVTKGTSDGSGFNGLFLTIGILMGVVVGVIGFGQRQKKREERKKEFKLKLHEEPVSTSDLFKPITKDTLVGNDKNVRSEDADAIDDLLDESLFLDSFQKKD